MGLNSGGQPVRLGIGVFGPRRRRSGDRRSRQVRIRLVVRICARAANIIGMTADLLADRVTLPDGSPVPVVYAPTLVDGEKQADMVARQFQAEGVDILVCVPDTWAFPQLSLISLLALESNCPPTENSAADCTPRCSRKRNSAERRPDSLRSDSSLAMPRALSVRSTSSESSAE